MHVHEALRTKEFAVQIQPAANHYGDLQQCYTILHCYESNFAKISTQLTIESPDFSYQNLPCKILLLKHKVFFHKFQSYSTVCWFYYRIPINLAYNIDVTGSFCLYSSDTDVRSPITSVRINLASRFDEAATSQANSPETSSEVIFASKKTKLA